MRAEFLSILFTAEPSRPGAAGGGQRTLSQHPTIKRLKNKDLFLLTLFLHPHFILFPPVKIGSLLSTYPSPSLSSP